MMMSIVPSDMAHSPRKPAAVPKTLPQPGSKHIPDRESLVDPLEGGGRHCERSEAIHLAARKYGLLRRFAPLRKRFAFVAGNDGKVTSSSRRSAAPSAALHRARR